MTRPPTSNSLVAMSLLPEIEPLTLLDGETVTSEWLVNREAGAAPFRGVLTLTDRRLVFRPQDMGLLIKTIGVVGGMLPTSATAWSAWLSDIAEVREAGTAQQLTEKVYPVVVEQRFGVDPETLYFLSSAAAIVTTIREAAAKSDRTADANRERWSIPANSVQKNVAVGGRLSQVGRSLVFVPSSFEKAFDSLVGSVVQPILSMLGREAPSEAREILLAEVASVEKLEGEFSLEGAFAGGLRDRMKIVRKDGTDEIFVVGDLEETMKRVERCVASVQ